MASATAPIAAIEMPADWPAERCVIPGEFDAGEAAAAAAADDEDDEDGDEELSIAAGVALFVVVVGLVGDKFVV